MTEINTIEGKFESVAEFSETISQFGWSVDFRQLDRGSGKAEFSILMSDGFLLQKVSFDRQTQQQITPPEGHKNFGILSGTKTQARIGREPLKHNALLCMRDGGEFMSIAEPGFDAYTLSFNKDRITRLEDNLGIPASKASLEDWGAQVLVDELSLSKIKSMLVQLLNSGTAHKPTPTQQSEMSGFLASDLPTFLLNATRDVSAMERTSLRHRERTMKRALEFIEANPREALTVERLCQESGASMSTLERAFRDRFSVSPKRYILLQRLHHAHKALLNKPNNARISDIALHWGFWHMGKFAADYKSLFGCLPSETTAQFKPTHRPLSHVS